MGIAPYWAAAKLLVYHFGRPHYGRRTFAALIKIDIEGGEYDVLRGGELLFRVQRPFLTVEVHHQQAADSITAWLDEHKYCSSWEVPKKNFPRRLFAWPTEQDGTTWMRARLDKNPSSGSLW
jgi:hypothetical protein